MKKFNVKNISILMLILLIMPSFIIGCSKTENENNEISKDEQKATNSKDTSNKDEKFENESYIVDVDWLKENLKNEDTFVLDARGEKEYNKGHIPGSVSITWQQFSNMEGKPGDENWGTVLESEELSKKLSEVGINDDKKIVVYSDTENGWGEDARIVWMLRRIGMDKPVMLDGGFNYWKSEGNEISKEAVKATPSIVELTSMDNSTNIETQELVEKLDKVKLIDVRSKKEFDGATDYGEPRGGHIPGAINIEFTEFLNDDGTLKNPSEIKAILDKNGIDKNDEIVAYCTAGIRSAHMQIVLDMMGYKNAKNYDQSFNAWAGDKALEVKK